MKVHKIVFFLLVLISINYAEAQLIIDDQRINILRSISEESEKKFNDQKERAIIFAKNNNLPIRTLLGDGREIELQYLDELKVAMYVCTDDDIL